MSTREFRYLLLSNNRSIHFIQIEIEIRGEFDLKKRSGFFI
jgi:hypothetical protein